MSKILAIVFFLFFVTTGIAKDCAIKQLSLNDFNEQSIMKLSMMYGYTRYFYPNPYIEKLDWHFYLENNIRKILELTNEQEVDSFLLKEFSILIPQLTFSSKELPSKTSFVTDSFFVKSNTLNTGFSQNTPVFSQIRKMKETNATIPVPNQYYSFPLYGNLCVSFPLALYELPLETSELKQAINESKGKWKKDFYISPYFRIANAIINNAFVQHFYAYYEEDGLDKIWLKSFKTHIAELANCSSYQEYLEYTYQHYAHVKDNHMYIFSWYHKPGAPIARYIRIYYPDIVVRKIEEKICIVDYASSYQDLRVGDEIVSVNDTPIETLIGQKLKFISASTKASLYDKLCDNFLFQSFTKDSVMNLGIKRDNDIIEKIQVIANKKTSRDLESNNFVTQIEKDIWMIDLCVSGSAKYKTFVEHIDQFQKAKGLIINLRGGLDYFSTLPILSHFIDSAITVGPILTPTFYFPNHTNVKYEIDLNSKWGIYPSTSEYKKAYEYEKPVPIRIYTPVVFLADSRAYSFGETIMEMIKYFKIGTIVGEHTGGTNGDAVILRTPATGYMFSGYKFLKHENKMHHGIGIIPDIECSMRVDDLRNGVDTQVKKACEIINKSQNEF